MGSVPLSKYEILDLALHRIQGHFPYLRKTELEHSEVECLAANEKNDRG